MFIFDGLIEIFDRHSGNGKVLINKNLKEIEIATIYLTHINLKSCLVFSALNVKFRWNTWKEDCKNIKLNEGFSFYPLLQADYDIEKRSRKIMSIDELIRFNLQI